MFRSFRVTRALLRLAALAALLLCCSAVGAGLAAAQQDPFVTNGPDQLGDRVSESEQATASLNRAVYGLVGLAVLISAGTIVFWRLSAPTSERVRTVQPAFRIEYTPSVQSPPVESPPVQPAAVRPASIDVTTMTPEPAGAWASQGWGSDDDA